MNMKMNGEEACTSEATPLPQKQKAVSDKDKEKEKKKRLKKEKKVKKEKKEKKKKHKKEKRSDGDGDGDHTKEKKKSSKRKNHQQHGENVAGLDGTSAPSSHKKLKCGESGDEEMIVDSNTNKNMTTAKVSVVAKKITFPIRYILAPMVGASELPFRILCRKYGAQTAYTPMMNSHKFANDANYRQEEFQTINEDRPLVCHFSSNDPKDFVAAAKLVEDKCDAIDLNLGCPQRTAYLGHFGSYLLEPKDRHLICSIVREAAEQITVPIFVKIRLLDSIDETIELCRQLKDAGASLICIHARYRASFERKGPGARDGPAMLDQVLKVNQALKSESDNDGFALITNGNVTTYADVENNLDFTKADGCMSAEGILDDPALFLPQLGLVDQDADKIINVPIPSALPNLSNDNSKDSSTSTSHGPQYKKKRKLTKKLREIEKLEKKKKDGEILMKEEADKIASKESVQKELLEIESEEQLGKQQNEITEKDSSISQTNASNDELTPKYEKIALRQLHQVANDKLSLAVEYLKLARQYPTKLRTVVFHTRRMLKHLLNEYQLMEECISSKSIDEILNVIQKMRKYQKDPSLFVFDKEKQTKEKEAMDRKRREEGKRKAYEARMVRKAKREGRGDLEYYLRQGAKVPTVKEVQKLRKLSKEKQMQHWKDGDHSQHCMAFHLHEGGCKRDRSCAFLHADALGENSFQEMDEVAG